MNPFEPKFARSRRDVLRAAEDPTPVAEPLEQVPTVGDPGVAPGESAVDEPVQPEVKAPRRKPVKAARTKQGRKGKTA